jgi:hypothetical protein
MFAPVQLGRNDEIVTVPAKLFDGLTQELLGPTSSVSFGLQRAVNQTWRVHVSIPNPPSSLTKY